MKTTMTVFLRKKTTEQYPENRKTLKLSDRFRGTLTMPHNDKNEHHCIACGLCQMACPNDTIRAVSYTHLDGNCFRGYCHRYFQCDSSPFVQSAEDGAVRVWYPHTW